MNPPINSLKPLKSSGLSEKPSKAYTPLKRAQMRQMARIRPLNWLPFGYPTNASSSPFPRARLRGDGLNASYLHYQPMTNFDWRGNVILQKLAEGCIVREAGEAAGISKRAVHLRMKASPSFREAVTQAREQGKDERTFRLWLNHPFRGCRPPTGKGHGGKPRFAYGRR